MAAQVSHTMPDRLAGVHRRHKETAGASPRAAMGASPTARSSSKSTINDGEGEASDEFDNILSLKLRRPKHWKWELSTSRSCSNIALPRILLYDHKGELLVDAHPQGDGQVYRQDQVEVRSSPRPAPRKRGNRSASTNLAQSIRSALDEEFNELRIQEATPSPVPSASTAPSTRVSLSPVATASSRSTCIDFYTNELPDRELGRRSSSLKGVRFNVNDSARNASGNDIPVPDFPTPPSTATPTTTTGSSSSGPREKRRYRRSRSTGRSSAHSGSILERFSFNKGRFSSPEFAEEMEVQRAPRYYLRTSKAGTLVVQEDSFSRYRRRRRPQKASSNETVQSVPSAPSSFHKSEPQSSKHPSVLRILEREKPQAGSLKNVAELRVSKPQTKVLPVRRYRSECNFPTIAKQLSTSEEEQGKELERPRRHPRKPSDLRKRSRTNEDHLVPIDSDNGVLHPEKSATSR